MSLAGSFPCWSTPHLPPPGLRALLSAASLAPRPRTMLKQPCWGLGGVRQPLSLLLKSGPLVSRPTLHGIVHTPGVAADGSHIATRAMVKGHLGAGQLPDCPEGCNKVAITAGVPRKAGMTWDDLLNTHATILATLTVACARTAPRP